MNYNLDTLNQYKVNRPGQAEACRNRLYDHQLYPAVGQAQMAFFQLPVGQGITSSLGAVVGTAKTLADTNMEVSGALPRPKSFLVESIEVLFEPGSSAAANTFLMAPPNVFNAAAATAVLAQLSDINTVRISGWLEFYIGSKIYLTESPIGLFPQKTGMDLNVAIANNSATTSEVAAVAARWEGRPYFLDPPITLESLQNFSVTLKWPGAVALPSGFNGRIGVGLDGVLYRLSQ